MFLSKGFNDYLAKPIEIVKLNEIMEKWIPAIKRKKTETHLERPVSAINMTPVLDLKKALEKEKTAAIDLLLDDLLIMPFGTAQKKVLSEIWDCVMSAEYQKAASLTDKLLN
jgi:YesN/AraC family two-component response regulator